MERKLGFFKTIFYLGLIIYATSFLLKLNLIPNEVFNSLDLGKEQIIGVKIIGFLVSVLSMLAIVCIEYILLKFIFKKIFKNEYIELFKRMFFVSYTIKFLLLTVGILLLSTGIKVPDFLVSLILLIILIVINIKMINFIPGASIQKKISTTGCFLIIALL